MTNPLQQLRGALEAYRRDEAMERVRRFRDTDGAESEQAVAERHRRLGDVDAVRELLEEVDHGRGFGPSDRAALRAHAARAAADLALAEGRDALEAEGRGLLPLGRVQVGIDEAADALCGEDPEKRSQSHAALVGLADRVYEGLRGARRSADEAGRAVFAGGAAPPDSGPPLAELVTHAGAFLTATDDIAEEARRHLAPGERDLAVLLGGLRAPAAGARFPRAGRFRRLADDIRHLGFGGDLRARVQTGGCHPFPGPRARMIVVSAPGDVRLFEARRERGMLSELAAAEVLGRALGHVLVAPALPVEERRPLAGSVSRAIGVLMAQLVTDRVLLTRTRGLSMNEADEAGRSAASALVLWARLRAAALVARATAGSAEAGAEAGVTLLQRALGVPVPIEFARLAVVLPAALGPRYRGTVAGLALAAALRERFDEDWFRNPRAAEPLRAAAGPGTRQTAEAVLGELGADLSLAPARLAELFG